jgi:hypothetical protein
MAKKLVTNTAPGPRGVLLADGTTHFVEPGQSVELDVADKHELYEGLEAGEAAAKKAAKAAEEGEESAAA